MNELKLIAPSLEYNDDIMAFRREIQESNDADSFAGCGSLRTCETAEEWLKQLHNRLNADTCPNGGVPSNTYLAIR